MKKGYDNSTIDIIDGVYNHENTKFDEKVNYCKSVLDTIGSN